MTEAEGKQSSPADVRAPHFASYTNAVDEDRLRRTREATLRGKINRLLTRPDSTRRTLQACADAIVNNLNIVFDAQLGTEARSSDYPLTVRPSNHATQGGPSGRNYGFGLVFWLSLPTPVHTQAATASRETCATLNGARTCQS